MTDEFLEFSAQAGTTYLLRYLNISFRGLKQVIVGAYAWDAG